MPPSSKLERLYHRAVKYPDPAMRFEALRIALNATEEVIAHQAAQYSVRANAELQRREMHPDDRDMEMYLLRTTTEELFPRVFRGGFLVSLWALFESGVKDLAEYTKNEQKMPFGLQDLRAGDFLGQTEKFFAGTLNIRPFPDKDERKNVEIVKGFRNALAHHDGNINEVPKALLQSPALSVQQFSDLHHRFAIPTARYNSEALELLAKVSGELAKAIYEKLHPSRNDA